jgi:hypothetical protein
MNILGNNEILSKFEELLEYKFNRAIHPYYGKLDNFDINKEETIKEAIRSTIIECFSDLAIRKRHKDIIEKRLLSFLPESYYAVFSDKDKNDLHFMAILVVCYVIRQLCEFLIENNLLQFVS